METYKVQADTTTGIYTVNEFEGETISQQEFIDELDTLREDEFVCAVIDQKTYDMLHEQYGILEYAA